MTKHCDYYAMTLYRCAEERQFILILPDESLIMVFLIHRKAVARKLKKEYLFKQNFFMKLKNKNQAAPGVSFFSVSLVGQRRNHLPMVT